VLKTRIYTCQEKIKNTLKISTREIYAYNYRKKRLKAFKTALMLKQINYRKKIGENKSIKHQTKYKTSCSMES